MLTIRLLGQFSLTLDDSPIEVPSRPAQSLLAWLVLHPGIAHRRERLAGLLWPDATEENARNNLRHALWRLRRAIPDEFVEADKIAIRWLERDGWSLDVARLQRPPSQSANPDELIHALTTYEGELLPGFYDEWVTLERERLIAHYESQMARLLDTLFMARREQEIIDWAERWIAQGRTPEAAYRGLMSAHANLGDRTAALIAYQRCVDALERELGVPPSAETVALAGSLRNSQFTTYNSQLSSLSLPYPTPTNLPAPTTPLIGRERELAHLSSLLSDPTQRLVTILGPGGMGKSRLALAAGHTIRERFPDGVFLVEMTPLTSIDEIPRAIGDALNYPFQNDSRSPHQQLLDYLSSRKLLLVLDNFEHLLEGAKLLIDQLEAAPGLRLLVTSRERLHLHAETLFRLTGLDFPVNGEGVDESFPFAGAQLFLQCAQRVRREFVLEEGSWPAILRICRMVDGMPLGIILAASWVEHLSPAEIADEIGANVAFLGQDLRDLDPRHRTIEAVFAQSWRRLSAEEQNGLMGLSIFAGGFDREAAQAVAGASLPVLTRLADKALLWRVEDGRYDLHELIRQLARRKLVETDRERAALSLHSGWYLALAARQGEPLKGREEAQATQRLEKERENIRVAWHWAAANRAIEGLLAALEALGIFYNHPGHWAEGERLMATPLAALGHPVEPQARLLNTWILAWQGVFLHRIGQAGQARLRLTAALDSLAETPLAAQERHGLEAFVYLHRAGDLMTDRQRDETGRELRRSLALYQEINDPWWTIRCLVALGGWELFNGQLGQAWKIFQQALQITQQLGDSKGEAVTLERMSFIAEHRGETAEGVRLAREVVVRQNDPSLRMVTFNRLTFALLAVGEFEESVTLAKEALAWGENIHSHIRGTAFLSNTLARGLLHLGRFDEGLAVAQTTVQHWQDAYGFEQPFLLRTVARALLALGNGGEAERLMQQTVESQRRMGNENLFALAGALVDCAYPALALGDLNETRRTLVQGLQMVERNEAFHFTCQSLPAVALLLASQNRLEEAAFVNGAIQRYPYLTRSRWYATVALDRLAELLTSLPAGLRSAAEERSRARDLPEMTAELLALLT